MILVLIPAFAKFIRLNFEFQHIEYLPLLGVLPLIALLVGWVLQKKRRIRASLGNPVLTRDYSPFHFLLKFCLAALALAAIILAFLNLQRPGINRQVQRSGVDVMIALDVSKSMLADDSKPNRLEKARQLIYKLMDELPDDRVGLVLFAGRAYLQMPLTTDQSAARLYVQNASPAVVPTQGTVIAEALRVCNAAFNSKERKYKSIILITDGEDHDAEAQTLGPGLAANGVMINTVGIGSTAGSTLIDPATDTFKKDQLGQTVVTKLNEDLLKQLAADTRGSYIHLDNVSEAVQQLREKLNSIEKSPLDDAAFRDYDSYFQWFIALALLLLLLEFFWPERKLKQA